MLEYVDFATARAARGTRIVTSALVVSPWSEAVKGMFRVAQLPALVVARANKTLKNLKGAWVKDQEVTIDNGKVTGYNADGDTGGASQGQEQACRAHLDTGSDRRLDGKRAQGIGCS